MKARIIRWWCPWYCRWTNRISLKSPLKLKSNDRQRKARCKQEARPQPQTLHNRNETRKCSKILTFLGWKTIFELDIEIKTDLTLISFREIIAANFVENWSKVKKNEESKEINKNVNRFQNFIVFVFLLLQVDRHVFSFRQIIDTDDNNVVCKYSIRKMEQKCFGSKTSSCCLWEWYLLWYLPPHFAEQMHI